MRRIDGIVIRQQLINGWQRFGQNVLKEFDEKDAESFKKNGGTASGCFHRSYFYYATIERALPFS
jgi:hypothetical protein